MADRSHLGFQHSQHMNQFNFIFNEMLDPVNIGLELEILIVSHLEAEILALLGYFIMDDHGHFDFQDG